METKLGLKIFSCMFIYKMRKSKNAIKKMLDNIAQDKEKGIELNLQAAGVYESYRLKKTNL